VWWAGVPSRPARVEAARPERTRATATTVASAPERAIGRARAGPAVALSAVRRRTSLAVAERAAAAILVRALPIATRRRSAAPRLVGPSVVVTTIASPPPEAASRPSATGSVAGVFAAGSRPTRSTGSAGATERRPRSRAVTAACVVASNEATARAGPSTVGGSSTATVVVTHLRP
jgi:hypothetical protein